MTSTELSVTQLVFFNQYRQLCAYSCDSAQVVTAYELLDADDVKRYVSLLINGSDLEFSASGSAPDPTLYNSKTYSFSSNANSIWINPDNEAAIVVGLGDIRDGITKAEADSFRIPTTDDVDVSLIIECSAAGELTIHYQNITVEMANVPDSVFAA